MASAWQIRQAAFYLKAGGVIAYPTETVYGLGCDPLEGKAVQRILELKQRPQEKGLILIAANLDQLQPFIDVDDPALLSKLSQVSPRPTTWICPSRYQTPSWLSGKHHSIAVRISQHPVAQQLCNLFGGAIVSTSANPAGLAPARSMLGIKKYFSDRLDFSLSGLSSTHTQPSRIIDLQSGGVIRD